MILAGIRSLDPLDRVRCNRAAWSSDAHRPGSNREPIPNGRRGLGHIRSALHLYVQLMYTVKVVEFPEFDWDEHNESHLAKHGISRTDAEDVLSRDHILLEYQMVRDEQRWIAVGATRAGRILTIVFAVRNEAVRPITGWVADKRTADLYVRQWGLE